MFLRMLIRAAVLRRGRAASALLAMIVASAVATAMLNLYTDVQAKLRKEFRNYGANIVVIGRDGASLPASALDETASALGGANASIAALFFTEAAILAVLGGAAGYGAGLILARQIGRAIFDSDISIQPVLFPIILVIAVVVTFAGSAAAIRKAVLFDPVFALRGEA